MPVLRKAGENYGIFPILYSDNDSKFRLIRYEGSRFFMYREETLTGGVIVEIHRALLELRVTLITHPPGNAQANRKRERLFMFIQERFISEQKANSLDELGCQLQDWINWYSSCYINQDTGCIPLSLCTPSAFREHNMVAFKVKLHIHPGKKIRGWYKDKFLCELPDVRERQKR